MELALITAVAVALGVHAHRQTSRPVVQIDPYTSWFMRQDKPALHR